MKLIFSSILFIAVAVSAETAEDPDRPYPDFLKKLNDVRREIARELHVADMIKLLWSPRIESTVAWTLYDLDSYSCFELNSLNDTEEAFEKMKALAREAEKSKGGNKYENGLIEALNPRQTVIGCSKREGYSGYVCCLGLSSSLTFWEFDSSAAPASSCGDTQFPIDDLCVPSCDLLTFSYVINDVRRKYAVRYGVPNMQYMHSEDTEDLDVYSLDATPYHSMTIDFCDYTVAEMESEIDKFVAMSETERAEYLKKPGLKLGEFIFPTSSLFLCDWIPSEKHHLCYVGPRVSNYLWNPNPNPLNPPGTGCDGGFKSDYDELCDFSIDDYREIVLSNVNWYRMTVAKHYNIGNMLLLSWSKELEEISNSNESEFESIPDFQVKWRYGKGEGDDRIPFKWLFFPLVKWVDLKTTEQDEFIHKNWNTSLEFLEFLNPIQSKIGCSLNTTDEYYYSFTCVLGPHGNFERLENQIKPLPGSNCPDDFHVKDGFCIQLGDSNEFLAGLNKFRQNYSGTHDIPNMQKIVRGSGPDLVSVLKVKFHFLRVWDKSLVKIAEKTDWSESKDPVVKDYRYVLLNDYRDIEKRLEKEVLKIDFLESDSEDDFRVMSKTSPGLLELLDPQRNIIGCAYKDQRIAPGLLCILGPVQKDVKSPPKKKTTLPQKPVKTLTKKPEFPAPEADESKATRPPLSNFWNILLLLFLASKLF